MSIREVPRSFIYTCDGCHKEHVQENASGHYSNSRPPNWATLRLDRMIFDYQGSPSAHGSTERLLCEECAEKTIIAINNALSQLK